TETLSHHSWSTTVSWLLTGEQNTYGAVSPARPVTGPAGPGAIELVLRYGGIDLDSATFPVYANPGRFAQHIRAWAAGINWHLTGSTKLMLGYEHTYFGHPGGIVLPDTESVFTSRLQLVF